MARLETLLQLTVSEYTDGTAVIRKSHMDKGSRRMVTQDVLSLELGTQTQMTALEMLFMGAAELLGRELYGEYPLPW